jgi:ubiquinone/menaquinone biosynthesis C-methylase UbiE
MTLVVDPDGVEIATIRDLVDLEGLRIVEIGCGDGRMTMPCAEEAASVLAFDPDEESIRLARAAIPRKLRRKIQLQVADAAEIELPESEFDLALFAWSL